MCSCSVKVGSQSDVIPGKVTGIPLNGVMKNDFFSLLAWAYCINPDKVKEAFKTRADLDIDSNDFAQLVKANASGADVKVHNVNFKDIITAIYFTPEEMDQASCKVILTKPK